MSETAFLALVVTPGAVVVCAVAVSWLHKRASTKLDRELERSQSPRDRAEMRASA